MVVVGVCFLVNPGSGIEHLQYQFQFEDASRWAAHHAIQSHQQLILRLHLSDHALQHYPLENTQLRIGERQTSGPSEGCR